MKSDEWQEERSDVMSRFMALLRSATGDGSKKRQAGLKPPWHQDSSHEAAIFSHLTKWKKGMKSDPDSGVHPLVHAAWRCLAIACIETEFVPRGNERVIGDFNHKGISPGPQAWNGPGEERLFPMDEHMLRHEPGKPL